MPLAPFGRASLTEALYANVIRNSADRRYRHSTDVLSKNTELNYF